MTKFQKKKCLEAAEQKTSKLLVVVCCCKTVAVNGEKVTDIHTAYEAADFDEEFVLKKGKKKFCKIVYK